MVYKQRKLDIRSMDLAKKAEAWAYNLRERSENNAEEAGLDVEKIVIDYLPPSMRK